MPTRIPVLDATGVDAAVERLADAIAARHPGEALAVVGIHTRGATLAARLADALARRGLSTQRGSIDINLYRDDFARLRALPVIQESEIHFPVDGSRIVLCDDVLFTGRTIRAALNEILDYGRPARIELAVLVDRGNRELPITADYAGLAVATAPADHIRVSFPEDDGDAGVWHERADGGA